MTFLSIAALILLVLILWFTLDFMIGYKKHIRQQGIKCYPRYKGKLTLFSDGRNLYDHYFSDLRQAQHSLKIQFYIVKNDAISSEFLDILTERASNGVTVRLLMDWAGSLKVNKKAIRRLKDAGAEVTYSHKPKLPFLFFTLQARNHRKITIIDGHIGYIGGFNIGKEYIGNDPKFGYWRDYHLKVEGKSVEDMLDQFNQDWKLAAGEKLKPYVQPELYEEEQMEHQFLCTNGKELDKIFTRIIKETEQELIICTPYFVPSNGLMEELEHALSRGVAVKIIVPMKTDHLLVREAAFPFFGRLLLKGCQIYRFYQGFYHAKVVVADRKVCDLGTANFDKRSLYLNDEINCFIYDMPFIDNILEQIEKDMERSELYTIEAFQKRPLLARGKEMIAGMVSRFL
ncbi:cardiolipin synthase [Metabacillus sp. GX 13764]|uniref:cardiolipin synthase n=1 Tax=Metabacillus kandeliae TaxID=2900151 RepID=UPI001E6479CF|nr:cardiolipin synthase [Metabacillus kandeliae]MCD7034716.1 cardiolipin synthase [Metabacillus kandeliae]